jgi:DNA-binding SARP family transcriptional activator
MIHRDRYQYELASMDIHTAELGFKANHNSLGVIQVMLTQATIENQQGYFQRALEHAEPFSHDTSIPSNLRGYALAIVGTSYLHLNQLEQASDLLETSLSLWRQAGDQFAIAQLLMTLEVAYLHLGRFDAAAKCMEEVLSIRRAHGESTSIILALNNLGYHYHLLGEYQQALGTLQEGLKISARISENRAINWLLQTLADLQRDQGAFNEADHLYRRSLQQITDKEPFLRANVLVGFSIMRRWENKLDEAQQLALEAKELCQKHRLNWEYLLATLALSAVDVYRNQFEGSRHELDSLIEEWKLHPSPQLIQVLAIYAYGALLAGNTVTAHHSLKLAIEHSGHLANLQPLMAEVVHNPVLRAFVERNADRYRSLTGGIKSLEKVQANVTLTQDLNLPTYSLRIYLLGRERVERDGKRVPLSDWKAASARELFYYLLFNRPSSREEIGLIFWPDSSPEQIRQKFHSTLHRIRDAIGTNVILFNDDLYSINPNLDLWCDVIELQTVIKQAELNSALLSHTESGWYRAVELYQGDFLPAFDAAWVLNQREWLRQKHLDSLLGLGNCLRIRGESKEAVSVLKRALKMDSYREDIHRALLNCYYALGEYALISQHIHELTNLLENELGTKPSTETLRLKQKLIG